MSGSSSDSDDTPKSRSSSQSNREEGYKASPASPQSSDESATSDGVLVELPGQDQSDGDRADDGGREETFVDAPDELGGRGIDLGDSMAMVDLGESSEEHSSPEHLARVSSECRKYKEEREVFGRQVAALRHQLQEITGGQLMQQLHGEESGQGGGEEDMALSSPTPLHSMVGDCSKYVDRLRSVFHENLQVEAMIRELRTALYMKDQEIDDLNVSFSVSSMSRDIIISYLHSLRDEWMEAFSYEIQQLGQCLADIRPDLTVSHYNDFGFIFSATRKALIESKRKEYEFQETENRLKEENIKMAEQMDKMKAGWEEAQAEASKSKTDLEQAESRLAAAKEKLSIAVTKGKSLVQHRDSLKQALAEKISELEKCSLELQQKSNALDTMEANAEGLKQSLAEKMSELEKCSLELQQKSNAIETIEANAELLKQSLAEKTSEFEKCLLDLQQKSNDLQTMEASNEELKQSLAKKNNELGICMQELQQKSDALLATGAISDELNNTQILVNSLKDSLSYKESALQEIEEIMSQIDTPADLLSLEVVDRVRWFVDQKQISESLLSERRKVKEALESVELLEGCPSKELESQIHWLVESFSKANGHIVNIQDELAQAQAAVQSHESEMTELHKEIDGLAASLLQEKQENDSLQCTLTEFRSKHENIAEKLSILSSEKEKLKNVLLELSESTIGDQPSGDVDTMIENCIDMIRAKINTFSSGVKQFEKMQSLVYVKDLERMLCEHILEEEMNDRSKLMSISNELGRASDEIITLRDEKSFLQKELERVEEKSSLLREKLSMAVKKGKGLVQEREGFKISLDEKIAEIEKLKRDLQLQDSSIKEYKEQIESLSAYPEQIQKLESDIVSLKVHKDEIEQSLKESNKKLQRLIDSLEYIVIPTDKSFHEPVEKVDWIAEYIHECEIAKAHMEKELEKVKEEATMQTSFLSDAHRVIKSLEDKLSQSEMHISHTIEEKKNIQLGMASIEQELKKIKEENFMQASKLEHASAAIKLLEEAKSQADEKISILVDEKNELESMSQEEITGLNAKLSKCLQELAVTHGNYENQSTELANHIEDLKMFMDGEGLITLMTKEFRGKTENLRNMGLLLQDMHNQFVSKGNGASLSLEEQCTDLLQLSSLPKFEEFIKDKMVSEKITDLDVTPSFSKIVEWFHAHAKLVGDNFQVLSRFMDDHIALASQALQTTKDEFSNVLELNESLRLNVATLEADKQIREAKISSLKKDLMLLLSTCSDATNELQIEFHDAGLDSDPEQQKWSSSLDLISKDVSGGETEEGSAGEYAKVAQSLLLAVRKVGIGFHQLVNAKRILMTSIDDLENKFKQEELTAKSAIEDRHQCEERISELERDLAELRNFCSELRLQIKEFQAKEDMLKDKEAELLTLQSTLTTKERGIGEKLFSKDQVEILIDKVNKMVIPFKELQATGQEVQFSSPIEKLYYVLDEVWELQRAIDSITKDKDDLQLIIGSHAHEIEYLKKVIETMSTNLQDLESRKTEFTELTLGLETIIQMLGRNESVEDKKTVSSKGLLSLLERLTMGLSIECENSKSRIQELGAKLQVKEKMVDDLSTKVKSLEESFQPQLLHPESVKERTLFEPSSATGSEISEIEDSGPLGKSLKPPVPAAAHVRAMRKGSADHLVLSIDPESERLITSHETDEKGHVFKSLNTSGLIPKQGKLVADRIDGIWVSGGRILTSRPGARLGLIAYCLLLHIWVLGTIL
ncbi:hypothetical protein J5N97_012794 [Dioscorea zingiberensis]|uniref:Uncharacterized protein n=1 Tax=Dioscorea zingiberensis TaxID=325984 RepID=A0A9D5CS65_9LILI|nr:hypothetical protein J5N97_012794 [Dioscorea zingiberensis]